MTGGFIMIFKIENNILVEAVAENNNSDYDITIPTWVTEIAENFFYIHYQILSVVLPEGVKKTGSNAFHNCRCIKKIELPNSIISIAPDAFSDCYDLKSITDVTDELHEEIVSFFVDAPEKMDYIKKYPELIEEIEKASK